MHLLQRGVHCSLEKGSSGSEGVGRFLHPQECAELVRHGKELGEEAQEGGVQEEE
jgi:hypothetical protein